MTVATEAAYAEAVYTGAETTFSPGFSALDAADVLAGYFDSSGLPISLTQGVHFSVALDPASGAVTVTRIAFPSASSGNPVTIFIERDTPATQGVDFTNLATFDPSVHQEIADSGAMRDAELKSRQGRTVTPFSASLTVVDFRPRTVRAAEPVDEADLATKFYADTVSGSNAQAGAEAAEAGAIVAETAAASSATAAAGSAASAASNAALLGNPDYGFFSDAPTSTRDYGSTW
jgi:hypothetical protein